MATVPSYGHLKPEDVGECEHWNQARERNPESALDITLFNPPVDHQLFTTGYDDYEELKKALDTYTLNAGWKSVVRNSHDLGNRLVCSKGRMRDTESEKKRSSTTKKCECG